jgi:hypothetical protein
MKHNGMENEVGELLERCQEVLARAEETEEAVQEHLTYLPWASARIRNLEAALKNAVTFIENTTPEGAHCIQWYGHYDRDCGVCVNCLRVAAVKQGNAALEEA